MVENPATAHAIDYETSLLVWCVRKPEPFSARWGGSPGPRPTPSSALVCRRKAGPGGPARTGASAPHTVHSV